MILQSQGNSELYNCLCTSITLYGHVESSDISNDCDGDGSNEPMDIGTQMTVDKDWDNALFLVKITCDHSLTHEGVNRIIQSVQDYAEVVGANSSERYVSCHNY